MQSGPNLSLQVGANQGISKSTAAPTISSQACISTISAHINLNRIKLAGKSPDRFLASEKAAHSIGPARRALSLPSAHRPAASLPTASIAHFYNYRECILLLVRCIHPLTRFPASFQPKTRPASKMSLSQSIHHPQYLEKYLNLPSKNGEVQAEYIWLDAGNCSPLAL